MLKKECILLLIINIFSSTFVMNAIDIKWQTNNFAKKIDSNIYQLNKRGKVYSNCVYLKPNKVYRFNVDSRLRPDIAHGWAYAVISTPYFGFFKTLNFANVEPPPWKNLSLYFQTYNFQTLIPSPFELWEDQLLGKMEFQKMQLQEAIVAHKQFSDGMFLGIGEKITGNLYQAESQLGTDITNVSRNLISYEQIYYHDGRWRFGNGPGVLNLQYDTGSEIQKSGKLSFTIWKSDCPMKIRISASNNGKDFIVLKEVQSNQGIENWNIDLPKTLYPCNNLRVKFENIVDKKIRDAMVQMTKFSYSANLQNVNLFRNGKTDLFTIKNNDDNLKITPSILNNNSWAITIKNISDKNIKIAGNLIINHKKQKINQTKNQFTLKPNEQKIITFKFDKIYVGHNKLQFKLNNNKNTILEQEFFKVIYDDSNYGKNLQSSTKDFSIWTTNINRKVPLTLKAPDANRKASALKINLAKNELESTQFILNSQNKDEVISCEISNLTNGKFVIPKENIELFKTSYVYVDTAFDYFGKVDKFPDPILPVAWGEKIQLKKSINQPLVLRIKSNSNFEAGIYKGNIKLYRNTEIITIPVKVNVYDFELPKKATLITSFGLRWDLVFAYHRAKNFEQKEKLWRRYLKVYGINRMGITYPIPLSTLKYTFAEDVAVAEKNNQPLVVFDWTEFDKGMKEYLSHNPNYFNMDVPGLVKGTVGGFGSKGGIGKYSIGTPEFEKLFSAWCHEVEEHLTQTGLMDIASCYAFDEPRPEFMEKIMESLLLMKKYIPKLSRMIPTYTASEKLIGGVNLWCPIIQAWDEEFFTKRREANERTGWYICGGPPAPYIGSFIDRGGVDLRLWGTQSYQYGAQMLLLWQSTYWTCNDAYPNGLQNPYLDTNSWIPGTGVGVRRPWRPGDGRFIYPPLECVNNSKGFVDIDPVQTLRSEALRDGVEDYEYLTLLKNKFTSLRNKIPHAKIQFYENVLKVPANVSKSLTEWEQEPEALLNYRDNVAKAIESLKIYEK